jgi:large subunit ribosomal protein L25
VECLPGDLPERIDVDISELKANQSIHVRDLALGSGVRIISNTDQVVALVKFARADAETAVEGETVAAETTEAKDAKETKT